MTEGFEVAKKKALEVRFMSSFENLELGLHRCVRKKVVESRVGYCGSIMHLTITSRVLGIIPELSSS